MRAYAYSQRQRELARRFPAARPPAGSRLYTRQMNLVTDDETHERIMDLAERHRVNVPEMVRTLIQWGLEQCD